MISDYLDAGQFLRSEGNLLTVRAVNYTLEAYDEKRLLFTNRLLL